MAALTLAAMAVGFGWLPSAHQDFSAGGVWDSICRAAGVPSSWGAKDSQRGAPAVASNVILLPEMTRTASTAAVGRGATLALNCTMCHGMKGMSRSDAPNLAGQYPEVIMKQLADYKSGKRGSPIMAALSKNLSDENIKDLAAYYASLPKARTAPTMYDESLPALVRVGAPMRNIAPCISCHGGVDQKLGAPWLEGMPKDYLVQQLQLFKKGERRNDGQLQMRNVANAMTAEEIDAVATFYARKALPVRE
ncbi:c-type cytochrome [Massilia sp. R2A-15]|uniref:c-type cytochrome n=1 Tax=Massilia sp. R2A-15 TaxID=3064278 RepID=UPI00273698C2|nr:c-type cytochrome [Massilia sp. R2A-15]WLI88295.1 c-type cytochrome [Massilia sp. R2A-15]